MVASLLTACAPQSNASIEDLPTTPQVQVQEIMPEPEPTPVLCDSEAGNIHIEVTLFPTDKAEVLVTGLQPGENIILIYERNFPVGDWRREQDYTVYTPYAPIGEDGTFSDVFNRFTPSEDGGTNDWTVKVVHSHGVSCYLVDLPDENSDQPVEMAPQTVTVNGVEITAANFRFEQNKLMIDTCFDLPDNGDWIIWEASLNLGEQEMKASGSNPMDTPLDNSRPNPQRCDTIYFEGLSSGMDFSNATFIVDLLLAYPREGEECSPEYLAKYQKALDERNTGITVECFAREGMSGIQVASKPDEMSEEEADAIIYHHDFFMELHGIQGPWLFPFNLDAQNANLPSTTPIPETEIQQVNNVIMLISDASRIANHFFVEACYTTPGTGVYDINNATLWFGPLETSNFIAEETYVQIGTEDQPGHRCMKLDFFEINTQSTSTTFSLNIGYLGLVDPQEVDACEVYHQRGDKLLAEKGIVFACDESYGFSWVIINKPEDMSKEEADTWIGNAIFGKIDGPWVFQGNIQN